MEYFILFVCYAGHFCEFAFVAPKDCPAGTYMPYGKTSLTDDTYVGPGQ